MYQTNGRIEGLDPVGDDDRSRDIDGWAGKSMVAVKVALVKEMRIPDIARTAVVYLGKPLAGKFSAVGTGFLVEHRRADSGITVQYLVTADHVRRALGNARQFAIRMNDGSGKAQSILSPTWLKWFT